MTIKSVKNALSFGRRKSVSEEQNLLGSSMETDRETEDEAGGESQEEIEKADTKKQRYHIKARMKHQLVFSGETAWLPLSPIMRVSFHQRQ